MNNHVTQLRWPERVRAAVVEAARINRRSINSEIIIRLEASLMLETEAGERAA